MVEDYLRKKLIMYIYGEEVIKMTIEEKLELLADAWDMDVEEIDEDAVLEDLDNWDSMTKLSVIVMFDECGKKITSDDIKKFVTVKDIIDAL